MAARGQALETHQSRITVPVDVDVLRKEIRKTYADVSTEQEQEFIFPTDGRGRRSSATPSPSSPAFRTRLSRVSPGSRTTGRSGASSGVGCARPRLRSWHRSADRRAKGEHARLLVQRAYTNITQGDLVDTYARSAFEDSRRKALKFGAMGSTIRASKPD
jgi:hypothetical protein